MAGADRPEATRLEVGRVGKPHGLRGEVHVHFTSDRPERWAPGAELSADGRVLLVRGARSHQGRMLVHFEGVDDRDAAETLRGVVLTAPPLDPLDDELPVRELIGSVVVDRSGAELGVVAAVEANPAHDLLVLEDGALVPAVFVVEQDAGRVVIDVPEGLLEVNRRPSG